jgi:putative oxidoreductase
MNPSIMLSILRIVAGLLFLEHGTSKILHFPLNPMHAPAHEMPHYMQLLGAASGPIELIGGVLITLGLLTRPVAFILSSEMAVAYFTAHYPKGFYPLLNQGEPAILYCFIFLYLVSPAAARSASTRRWGGNKAGIAPIF